MLVMVNIFFLLAGLICSSEAVSFHLFRRTEPRGVSLTNGLVPPNFDRSKATFVLLHGLGGHHEDICMSNIASALLETRDANVIIPNFSQLAIGYTGTYQTIARSISSFLSRNLIDASNSMALGQSMGAQVAGVLHKFGFRPNTIIGMDPAGPQFSMMPASSKLSQQSAQSVQAIHTNVGGLGSRSLDGHLDVFINGGNDFPCCRSTVCNHIGACDWFAQTIRYGTVPASTCSSQLLASRRACQGPPVLTGFGAPAGAEPDGIILKNDTTPADFEKNNPTFVLLHGFGGNYEGVCMKNLANALLKRNDVNVVIPDFSLSAFGYVGTYLLIARRISQFLLKNQIDPTNTMVLGQSMGAQIGGVLYKFGFQPDTIIGMDPAGPLYSFIFNSAKLTPRSAKKVQAVHTNVGEMGSLGPNGHLDVYINGGNDFPCCQDQLGPLCNHIGSCDWIADTVRKGPVEATSCGSQHLALKRSCEGPNVLSGFGAPIRSEINGTIVQLLLPLDKCISRGSE